MYTQTKGFLLTHQRKNMKRRFYLYIESPKIMIFENFTLPTSLQNAYVNIFQNNIKKITCNKFIFLIDFTNTLSGHNVFLHC